MIKKVYTCDICKKDVKLPTPSNERRAARVRWATDAKGEVLELKELTDDSCSETVICGRCLNLLPRAIAAY